MESKDKFSINEKLEISAEKGECFYKTIVLGVDSKSIIIGMPMFRNKILLLYERDWVVIKKTKDDALYYYSSQIISRQRENQIAMYEIQYPQLYERVQRRKFLRLPCMVQVNYRRVNPEDEMNQEEELKKPEDRKANRELQPQNPKEKMMSQAVDLEGRKEEFCVSQSIDISGGGAKFYTEMDYSPGQLLEVEIILPDYTVRTHARVVYATGGIGLLHEMDSGKWAAVEFFQLPERERDILVAFIFKKMRERL